MGIGSLITGEHLWDWLVREGGFVHTFAAGTMKVRFNRGRVPSDALRAALAANRAALKDYVREMHAHRDRAASQPLPRLRYCHTPQTPAPNGGSAGKSLTNEKGV